MSPLPSPSSPKNPKARFISLRLHLRRSLPFHLRRSLPSPLSICSICAGSICSISPISPKFWFNLFTRSSSNLFDLFWFTRSSKFLEILENRLLLFFTLRSSGSICSSNRLLVCRSQELKIEMGDLERNTFSKTSQECLIARLRRLFFSYWSNKGFFFHYTHRKRSSTKSSSSDGGSSLGGYVTSRDSRIAAVGGSKKG
ncbi:hypothetical protein L6452_24141 [Arctium lappa]|uniref:Uncharacterized protein n=1 Tax=Arctium lappa TaxID=4217 RepID=A0ACB9A8V6_ARCLA|nr:hypothetical protein L6452_24141 [Arctium lappa]